MTNIVFGVYNGYNSLFITNNGEISNGGIYYFITSLRKYNKDCKIVVVCENHHIFNDLNYFSKIYNFEIYSNFHLEYEMMFYRFEIYNKYLNEQREQNITYDKIFISDMNDVIFQDDPFSITFTEELYCGLEGNNYNDIETNTSSKCNMNWLNECKHLFNNYDNYKDKYVICAGTILGTYHGIKKYLDFYLDKQSQQKVNDQGLLNVYIYNYSTSHQIVEYKKSRILTLDLLKFETLNIDYENNIILNENGEKYAIIHQINRCNLPFMLKLITNTLQL